MASRDFRPVTAFQVSEKGYEIIKKISQVDKEAVHECVYAPHTQDLLRVVWDGDAYSLVSDHKYKRCLHRPCPSHTRPLP